MLQGKRILVGVSGGIAAFKIPFLVRSLIKEEAEVKVVMTAASLDFVTPLTLSTLSKNPVHFDFINEESGQLSWNNHVALALWADYIIIAPATANTLAKMSTGICDNLLLATYLSSKCPVFVVPAMDLDMYKHDSTKQSLETLKSFGNTIIPAEHGELASGLSGEGRMAEPDTIISCLKNYIRKCSPLYGKKVLITAGPTYEPIDPVRFLGNYSTGTMGFELAKTAARLGARVVLVTGPSHLTIEHNSIEVVRIQTAQEMFDKVEKHYPKMDIVIGSAAVADFRVAHPSKQKIKKSENEGLELHLEPNVDIIKYLGAQKNKQYLVGFALETQNELLNAKDKIKRKNLDAIVLNSLNDKEAGFGTGTNKITFIDKNFSKKSFEAKTKDLVANDIWSQILKRIDA